MLDQRVVVKVEFYIPRCLLHEPPRLIDARHREAAAELGAPRPDPLILRGGCRAARAVISAAMVSISGSPKPRVVTAGVPMRMPLA